MKMQARAMGGFRVLNDDEIIAVSGGYLHGNETPWFREEGSTYRPAYLSSFTLPYGQNVDTDGDGGADTIVVTATLDQMRSAGILSGGGAVTANNTMSGHSITCQLAQSAQLQGTVAAGIGSAIAIAGVVTPLSPATTTLGIATILSGGVVAGLGALTAIVARC